MTLPLFHEDLCELFQRSNEPFIFSKLEPKDVTLEDFEPDPHHSKQSIRAMRSIMDALLHLRLNLVMPCQLRFSYIIKRKNTWGLRHAICDRNEQQSGTGDDVYNPEEFKYHLNSQNQLMWNLGKVWLRFFTSASVRIKYDNQEKINKIIDEAISYRDINSMVKKLLCWEGRRRIAFEEFLSSEFFINQQDTERSSFYSSVLGHLKNLSRMGVMDSRTRMNGKQMHNPYVRQVQFRCFLEYLQIDLYLQSFKAEIRKEYMIGESDQNALCEFTLYIVSLQNYINMVNLNKERLELGERFEELEHRFYYARFTKRMITLKEQLEKMVKKLRINQFLPAKFGKYLKNPDEIDPEMIYEQFKSCLSEYARFLNEDLKKNNEDLTALKLLAKIYISRTSSYIFNEMRSEVFRPFLKGQRSFNIKRVLSKVNECNNRETLRELLMNIKQFYFTSSS